MLTGKTILLGVTGGIAAYKAAALSSALVKLHASVEVVMTEHATKFIAPLTFEQLTGNRVSVDTFDRNFVHQVEHISLARRIDLVMIAPATANVCAKLAHGIADDMLTTTVLAMGAFYVAPQTACDIADAYLSNSLGSGWEWWHNFYEFHKLAIDELEAFDYEEYKKNGFKVHKLGDYELTLDFDKKPE